ncbi:RNA-binding protein [Roseiconus nitratireducens]|uniref:RNA-binding protein n=1 Tax=Roseiconus nitratireducens TaxID=2605748 RepID=A0A5M6D535_9BACT|nr:FG-GAP-like repeat-containing protein [Roseiconus nitratireducens]KAA5541866.1 RNA-binding protein [Roseiconus nitratireducens]
MRITHCPPEIGRPLDAPSRPAVSRGWVPAILLCIGILFAGCDRSRPSEDLAKPVTAESTSENDTPSKFQTALQLQQRGNYREALSVVQAILIESPQDLRASQLAMALHDQMGQNCEAAAIAESLAETGEFDPAAVLLRAFDWYLRCGDYAAAEKSLRRAVELMPDDVQVHRSLAELLNAQGRRLEASEHIRELIRLRAIRPNEILSLIDLRGPFALASFDQIVDASQLTLFSLGKARHSYEVAKGDWQQILDRLQQLTQKFPDSTSAAAFRSRLLVERGQFDTFAESIDQLPEGIEEQPEYWNAVGRWMAHQERHREAVRAYGEALRRDPTDRQSLREMIGSLESLDGQDRAAELRKTLADLDKIFRIAKDADPEQARWISNTLQELTRPWESAAWWMYAAQMSGQLQQQIPELNRRAAMITAWEQGAAKERIAEARLRKMLGFDLASWPLPELDVALARQVPSAPEIREGLRFEDVAAASGIRTRFQGGYTGGGAMYAYQINGGGLAVIDYDLDGVSDLYVAQSGGVPNDSDGSEPNQLFRGLDRDSFVETTQASMAGDRGYCQGVCAGDVNQDGFPDLLVGNIGINRVYLNQGDGTFSAAEHLISDVRPEWTSSIAVADVTGDHLPEIIEINYIDDPEAYKVRCEDDHLLCQPQRFNQAADRILRGLPDGRFEVWQAMTGPLTEAPKLGFGTVIANFDRQNGNDFFVSNDGDLNHYWTSQSGRDSSGSTYTLVESAGIRGCSVGRDGNSQACMGIAAGDFDRDGTLDLHVTNFRDEPVNLFKQTESGFFSDQADAYQLVEPSFGVLGFGTQAADFDNDGWLDLAVLNGHVYDARPDGLPFQMKPQLFRGKAGAFVLQDAAAAGPFWQTEALGRTLAQGDFNRDGRMDLVASHLDQPIALLQNRSEAQHWVQLELIGVTSERDAIGAEVRVRSEGQQWTGWVTGGDGLACTNEAVVHIGLGQTKVIDQIQVHWPSGSVQQFVDVDIDRRYLAIENSGTLVARP